MISRLKLGFNHTVRNQRFRQVYTRRNRQDRGMGQNTSPIVNNDDRAEVERLVS